HVIVFAPFYIALSSLLSAALFLYVLCYDLVVNVCKIRYIIYFITSVLHISAACIEDDHRPGISNMDKVIDRTSAYIHFHLSFFQRNEFFFSLCQGIIDFHFLFLFFLFFLIYFFFFFLSFFCFFWPVFFFLSFSVVLLY